MIPGLEALRPLTPALCQGWIDARLHFGTHVQRLLAQKADIACLSDLSLAAFPAQTFPSTHTFLSTTTASRLLLIWPVPCRPLASTTSAWAASIAGQPRARRPAQPAVHPSQPSLPPTPASTLPWHQSFGLPSWALLRLLPSGPLPGHAMRSGLMRPSGMPSSCLTHSLISSPQS